MSVETLFIMCIICIDIGLETFTRMQRLQASYIIGMNHTLTQYGYFLGHCGGRL